jgi:hypothetical protein
MWLAALAGGLIAATSCSTIGRCALRESKSCKQ